MAATNIYAGAGKWRGGSNSGVFRFTAGEGQCEQLTNGLPPKVSVQAVTVHPLDPNIVFIGTEDGLYLSQDRGNHWMKPDFPDKGVQIWSILVHPGAPRTILAGGSPVSVYRSDDGGERWRRIAKPPIRERAKMDFACRMMRLALDAKKPDDVFGVIEVNGVMRSRDGGESWTDCSDALIAFAKEQKYKSKIGSDTEAEGMLDGHALCVSEADPGAVFLANRMGLFRSGDGGDTWQDLEVKRFGSLSYARDVRPAPSDPKTLYACLSVHSTGNTGSLARSTRSRQDVAAHRSRAASGGYVHEPCAQCARSQAGMGRDPPGPGDRHDGWRRKLGRIPPAAGLRRLLRHRLRLT